MTTQENVQINLKLPTLHKTQQKVYDSKARFKILSCGRRWGKTSLAYVFAVKCAVEGGRVWWIAPTSSIAGVGWRLIHANLKNLPGIEINITERRMFLPTGGEIWFKSADNPDGLRGEGLKLAIFDEAAYIGDEVWDMIVSPMLADELGSAVFISTPKGVGGYFHELWMMGQEKQYQDNIETNWLESYESWKFPSSARPSLNPQEVEANRKRLPKLIFQQEWLAEFVADGESVFKNIDDICILNEEAPYPGGWYVAGIDWGNKIDATVLSIFDAKNRKQVKMVRMHESDFDLQYAEIERWCKAYGISKILVEENAIGIAPFQALRNRGLPVIPFETSNSTKFDLVSKMVHATDTKKITLLNDSVLKNEMKIYEQTRTSTGLWRFAAKGKGHDDTVMATMLAVSLLDTMDLYVPMQMVQRVQRTQIQREQNEFNKMRGGVFSISHGYNGQS